MQKSERTDEVIDQLVGKDALVEKAVSMGYVHGENLNVFLLETLKKLEQPKAKSIGDEPILRCKMKSQEVVQAMDEDGKPGQERVKLQAVYGNEGTANKEWSKWTPSANFEIYINNPAAFGKLSRGGFFFVDFTPATATD